MKILVTVKRVTDYEAKLKVIPGGSDIEKKDVNMIMNPFDEIAVEEALRIKEKNGAQEVVVVSIGDEECETQLRAAMAMGADRGILIKANLSASSAFDSAYIAKLLKKVVERENPNLIIMGKQSIDSDNHQVSEMLAELCDYGQATQANTVEISANVAKVKCEADGGLKTVEVELPCIITTDLRLNEPRYAPLPGIMKAKKKPLDIIAEQDLGIQHEPWVKISNFTSPPKRSSGVIVKSVEELINKLKTEAKVLN